MNEEKRYTLSVKVKKFWMVVVPALVLLCITGTILGILVVDRIIIPQVVSVDRGIVEVPDITGMPWREARQKLYNKGLRLNETAKEYNDTVARGNVITQKPLPGTKIDKSKRRSVRVKTSKGSEIATIPDMRDVKVRIATRKLKEQGFTIGETRKKFSSRIEKENVIGTAPEAHESISREVPLTVYVSKGKKPTSTTVPNVVGEILSQAKETIKENELSVGSITTRKGSSSKPGMVISQSIAPGTKVPFQSSVNLTVSAGAQ